MAHELDLEQVEACPKPEIGPQHSNVAPSVYTASILPPDATRLAFDIPNPVLQDTAVDVGSLAPGAESTIPVVPLAVLPEIDPATVSVPWIFSRVTPNAPPVVTSQDFPGETCLAVPQQPTMASWQTTPSPVDPAPSEAQTSVSKLPLLGRTPDHLHSPMQVPGPVSQTQDSTGSEESLTLTPQGSSLEGDPRQPSLPATISVSQASDPAVPEAPQTSSSGSSPPAPQPPVPTSISDPQSNDFTGYKSPWLRCDGAVAELCECRPLSTGEKSKADASQSRQSTPSTGTHRRETRRISDPIITDTNRGLPIVIDDTDDEIKGEADAEMTNFTALRNNSRLREPQGSHKRNLRKRARAQGVTNDQWALPRYERELLCKLNLAFYKHEFGWMRVRNLPGAMEDPVVEKHNELVQDIGQIACDTASVTVEKTRNLRDSYIDVSDRLLTKVDQEADKSAIAELQILVDEIQDHAINLVSVQTYLSGGDDECDKTYRPSKKRRSRGAKIDT